MAAANAVTQQRPRPFASTPNTPEGVNKILDTVGELTAKVDKQAGVVEGLMKALEGPAKQAGMSPAALLSRMSGDGRHPLMVGGDGTVQVVDVNKAYSARRVGKVAHKDADGNVGEPQEFGSFLKDMYTWLMDSVGQEEKHAAMKRLDKLGVQRIGGGGNADVMKTALAESSGVTGGYTVPPMFAQQLQMLAIEESVVQGMATSMPLTSRTLLVPSLDQTTTNGAGVSNLLSGVQMQWLAEAATRPETEPQFRQTELTAWELSGYAIASNTLLADNAVGLDAVLTMLFSASIAWYTEYAFLQGNGVGKPMGVLNAPATIFVNRDTTSYVHMRDFANLYGTIYFPLLKSGKLAYMTHQSALSSVLLANTLAGATTTYGTGNLVYQPWNQGMKASPTPWEVFGCPLYFTEKLPAMGTKGDLILCDWSKYLVGNRMELQIEVSPHVKFLNNQLVWRIVARIDGQPWLNNPVTLADGVKQVSPFVGLSA